MPRGATAATRSTWARTGARGWPACCTAARPSRCSRIRTFPPWCTADDNADMNDISPMAAPIAPWHEEHVYFGQLLELLQREVLVFHTGARPNYELMSDIVSYLRDYGDQFHHPREDVAFARLVKHVGG